MTGYRRHKYGAKPTMFNGRRYASRAEATRAAELQQLERSGVVSAVLPQPVYHLGCTENRYVADFEVHLADGTIRTEDVKGFETPVFRHNRRLWASYGPHPLLVLKRRGRGWKTEVIPGANHATEPAD